ncbi:MAG: aldo/keto reductase [Bifidobacterium scardovii]|uniref:aldo/keto reductase n=2 Tax=Bifidobacterium scardovii TaxID=158787 RepID=UPI0019553B9A|nr:aldo/keto reductase [Bifidobacterium scardovii]MBS6948939.1 aldo/keto reductase [Bifidobacterium scardovii]MDU5886659.1 aldo/keto reductase [Bifidobacterium scardovii]MDU6280983.1 aldo/keto reductase [Bifidobacterium scardovii]
MMDSASTQLRSPELTLNDKDHTVIPQIGFGTFQIPPEDMQRAVEEALEIGYRHIDTAAAYYNEEGVGAALKATGMAGKVWVTTKLRNCDQGYDPARFAFDQSCRKLGVDVVDMYLIHWPFPAADQYRETWRALLSLRDEGAIRVPGVSNFLPEHLRKVIEDSGETPAVNQIEVHPRFSQPDNLAFCKEHGITVEAFSPLGHGKDIESGPVAAAAAAHGVTPAQVVLRWHTQEGRIVIPKSKHVERMKSNLASAGFDLSADELAAIDALHDPQGRVSADPATFVQSQSWANQHARGNV